MGDVTLLHRQLTGAIIGAFFETYDVLGAWFAEHLYAAALERELRARGHRVSREVAVTVTYKGEPLGQQRLDMVVDDLVIVEIKATERLHPRALQQLYGYLRSTRLEVGLLLHYGPRPAFHRAVQTNDRIVHYPGERR